MLSCIEISFVIPFSILTPNFEFGAKHGFPFTQFNQATYSKTWGGGNHLTCFATMIAEQSPVNQYA